MRLAGPLLIGLACFAAAALAAPSAPVTIIANRGLSRGLPENTMAAFRNAVAQGVAVIEVDIRPTKDGQLIILHDETLDRTTDCSGLAAELTLAKIRHCDAGWPSRPGERVPTLGEALDFIRTTDGRLLLDIKPGTPLDPVTADVRRHRAEAKVIFGLRRADEVASVRRQLPQAATLGFMPEPDDAAAFARAGVHAIRLWSDWIEADLSHISRVRSLGAEVWIMVGRKLPRKKSDWRALHARMIAAGPDALITDHPELVP